jgi:hypothetical protein
MKVLEEDVEKSLQREESRLDAEEQIYPDDIQKVAQELKSKHIVSIYSVTVEGPLKAGYLLDRGRATTQTHERDGNETRKGGTRCG